MPDFERGNEIYGIPDESYYGYKIVHHMGAVVEHIDKFGFNTFDHPRMADYRSFVITPALDHFYSKAVADVRFAPVIVDTPAKDNRYSSIEIFDMEHHAIFDKVTSQDGERFVLVHQNYEGKFSELDNWGDRTPTTQIVAIGSSTDTRTDAYISLLCR